MKNPKTSAIIVAGGIGSRMGLATPKQFLQLSSKPVARHSFDLFMSLDEIDEIIVVCEPRFRHLFASSTLTKPIHFALPGKVRQESTYNGLLACAPTSKYICVHDAARPFIDKELVLRVLAAAYKHGAATAGMKVKFTIKETSHDNFVISTPDRNNIWEIQTPQVIQRELLQQGFDYAISTGATVTDDVSLVELIGTRVKIVEGSHRNIKITVPQDLTIANELMQQHAK